MHDGMRASDADRDSAAAQLHVHFAAGRLTRDELDDRLTVALRAVTFGDLRLALAGLPRLAPGPRRHGSLERGYRRLLAFYPPRYRRVHEEEMLAVLMTAAPEGKRRPGLAEAADLIAGALRVWCQPSRGRGWRGVLALISAGAVLGLLAGAAFATLNPPLRTSYTMVMTVAAAPDGVRSEYRINLPPSYIRGAERQELIEQRTSVLQWDETRTEAALADSREVMAAAASAVRPSMSVQTLRGQVRIKAVNDIWMWISAQGTTAAQAESAVSAVAHSYIAYVNGKNTPGARILLRHIVCQRMWPRRPGESKFIPCSMHAGTDSPGIEPGRSLLALVLDTGGLGALCGALIGAFAAAALSRPSRRFRVT
jgi:hypothetical protein